ncbi:reverse transcriptase [Hordeum vulgare]|nr:reverse transcriptase [Hordeum vulgare]
MSFARPDLARCHKIAPNEILKFTQEKLRMVHLQFIIDRVRSRLAGWKGKLLNLVARGVLVRAVLTALPTFALTDLKVPKKILKEVDKA